VCRRRWAGPKCALDEQQRGMVASLSRFDQADDDLVIPRDMPRYRRSNDPSRRLVYARKRGLFAPESVLETVVIGGREIAGGFLLTCGEDADAEPGADRQA
jgi:hypothetical protein